MLTPSETDRPQGTLWTSCFGFRVSGLGIRVSGFGCRVCTPARHLANLHTSKPMHTLQTSTHTYAHQLRLADLHTSTLHTLHTNTHTPAHTHQDLHTHTHTHTSGDTHTGTHTHTHTSGHTCTPARTPDHCTMHARSRHNPPAARLHHISV